MPESESERMIYFKLIAYDAKKVYLVGTFNNWNSDSCFLKQGKNGAWRAYLKLKPGTYQYRFNVDGQWLLDPDTEDVINSEDGYQNSVLVVA